MIDKNDYAYRISAAGRINIIGEHIDYCGGKVFPAAISLCNTIYIRPNGTNFINIRWTTLSDVVNVDINNLEKYKDLKYAKYQVGCAILWKQAGHKLMGCDMLYDCSVPFGSGLSSSAAIEVSTLAAFATLVGEELDKVEIAKIAQKAEHIYAGVNCGIMDQYASACGVKNQALLLDCKTLECKYVPLELGEYSLVILDCKKPHNLVESRYNERRAETDTALNILKKVVDISCLAELTSESLEKHKNLLTDIVYKRVKHVVDECKRVEMAQEAMKEKNIIALGKLLTESHLSLKNLYEVTGKELDEFAFLAQQHEACIGSRMIGGGFGGCTISIVKSDKVLEFKDYVLVNYKNEIGYNAEYYETNISDGIVVERLRF